MKVLYKGNPYKVYGTHTENTGRCISNVDGKAIASFLIYIDDEYRWVWVSSDYCMPYKKKKHKKEEGKRY